MTDNSYNSNYHLLIVDDDDDILLLLTKWLEDEGFTITTAKSGKEALTKIATVNPRLIRGHQHDVSTYIPASTKNRNLLFS